MARFATHAIPLTLTILLSILDAEAAPRPVAPLLHMDLLRKRSSKAALSDDEWFAWAGNQRESLKAKYGSTTATDSEERRRATTGSNSLINQDADSSYIGSLAVGTPLTSYNVILDTGSSDFWLASPECTTCGGTPTFTTSQSSTFKQLNDKFSVSYGSGSAAGILGQDVVQMAGFEVPNQPFGVCDDISSDFLSRPVSGLMGLGFQSIASSGVNPFWENLVQGNAWSEPVMAFAITRFDNQTNVQDTEPGGTFTMGGTNTSLYTGSIEYTDIPSGQEGFWVLPLKTMTVQGTEVQVSSSESNAAIDTGTTLIAGPSDVVTAVYQSIPNAQAVSNQQGYFAYPCQTEINLSLNFGGSSWSISPDDFVAREINGGFCVGALFAIDLNGTSTPDFIIGDTFLKNVYTAFRFSPPSVGFAHLSGAALSVADVRASVPSPTTVPNPLTVSATAAIQSGGTDVTSGASSLFRPASTGSARGLAVLVLAGLVGAALAL